MTDLAGFRQINEMVEREARFVQVLDTEIRKAIVGQDRLVERALVALLADGHILLEGVPGLAKTLLVKTIGQAIQAGFSRIQFTPDLLPADLIGTRIYNPRTGDFSVQKGPVFSNLILADEVNRAPAKVQSALLEAMQEKQVTIGNETFQLDAPFLVLATQNPIEQEGTYPLPEAQVDRFMLKVIVGYPERSEEREIINRMTSGAPIDVQPVVDSKYILSAREIVRQVYVDEKIKDYVLDLVVATRDPVAAGLNDLREPDLLWRIAPRRHLPHRRGTGLCIHQGARLCRSRRYKATGPRHSPAPHHHHFRGRSAGCHFRTDSAAHSGKRGSPVIC